MITAKKILVISSILSVVILTGCSLSSAPANKTATTTTTDTNKQSQTALANPASVNCGQKGGTPEIVTALDGSQSGICRFPDGTQCEEWAFYRNQCNPGIVDGFSVPGATSTAVTTVINSTTAPTIDGWLTYQNKEYKIEFQYPKAWPAPTIAAGVYTGGYPGVRSNWRINLGPVFKKACEASDCYGLYFDRFTAKDYKTVLKELKADEFITNISEKTINGSKVILFTEGGMKDYTVALIFGTNQMIELTDEGFTSQAGMFSQILTTFKFIK